MTEQEARFVCPDRKQILTWKEYSTCERKCRNAPQCQVLRNSEGSIYMRQDEAEVWLLTLLLEEENGSRR